MMRRRRFVGLVNETPLLLGVSTSFIIHEGDSITQAGWGGTTDTTVYPYMADHMFSSAFPNLNNATGGLTIALIAARGWQMDALYDATRPANLFSVLIGHNDLDSGARDPVDMVADLKTYCLARKATGWKVIVLTQLPSSFNPEFNARRNVANTLTRADPSFYDALCDVGADPVFGTDASGADTEIYLDGIHPTPATHARMAPYLYASMQSLL